MDNIALKVSPEAVVLPAILGLSVMSLTNNKIAKYSAFAIMIVAILVVLWFFRVPHIQVKKGGILAASYGTVLQVDKVSFNPDVDRKQKSDGNYWRIVTFLSPLDVHIQRAPVDGPFKTQYFPGTFAPAMDIEKSDKNERMELTFGDIKVILIAGTLARTIELLSTDVQQGDIMSVIKLGSRVDMIIPDKYEILVKPGDILTAGVTRVA